MSVIAILIERDRVTRIFFDYRRGETSPEDEARIDREIARAYAADAMEEPRQAA